MSAAEGIRDVTSGKEMIVSMGWKNANGTKSGVERSCGLNRRSRGATGATQYIIG
jgi:hypothetical protein